MGRKKDASKVLKSGIQNKKLFKYFITSYVTFFLIPLIVCLIKLCRVIYNLIKNISHLSLEPIHKLIFIIVIFMYLYDTIYYDLDLVYGFPYSYMYIAICAVTVFILGSRLNINSGSSSASTSAA